MNSLLHVLVFVIAVSTVHTFPEQPKSIEALFRPLGMKLREARMKAMVKIMRNTQVVVKKLCAEQNGATQEDVARIQAGDFENASNSTKCYINCFNTGMGIVKDGVFQLKEMTEAVSTLLPPDMAERAKKAMEMCMELEGEDVCDKSFNLAKCFKTADKEVSDTLLYPPTSEDSS